jgi:hypothetical protein
MTQPRVILAGRWMPLVAGSVLLFAARAEAQAPFDACFDRLGQPIPSVADDAIGRGGVATYQGGQRVILWNNEANKSASLTTQLFLYLRACAQHNLGHLQQRPSPQLEGEADCWAIQLMVDGGMIGGRNLDLLQREQVAVRGDDNLPGGKALIDRYEQCLAIRTDAKAWAAALAAFTAAAPDSFAAIRGHPVEDAMPGIHESKQDAPGTYDCEVRGMDSVRCLVFAARKAGAARKRYQELVKIFRGWLPPTWTSIEQGGTANLVERQFLAQDSETNTVIALLVTSEARVYFVVRRMSADVSSIQLQGD